MKMKFVLFPLLVFGGVSTILAEQLPQLEKVPPSNIFFQQYQGSFPGIPLSRPFGAPSPTRGEG